MGQLFGALKAGLSIYDRSIKGFNNYVGDFKIAKNNEGKEYHCFSLI